jgi:hypothetical protein
MSIREAIAKKPALAIAVTVIVIGGAVYLMTQDGLAGGRKPLEPSGYFTADDGQTTFVAPLAQLPPFDYRGKPAYRAFVYTCDSGATNFVGYLQRYTPAARERLQRALENRKSGQSHDPVAAAPNDVEVKKPGTGAWLSMTDPAAAKVTTVTCPGGGVAEPLMP